MTSRGALLFIRHGRTLLKRSYRCAIRDAGIRAVAATLCNLGSLTKQCTAAAIVRLEEFGKLRASRSSGR